MAMVAATKVSVKRRSVKYVSNHREDIISEPISDADSLGAPGNSVEERLKEDSSVSGEKLSVLRQSISYRRDQVSMLYGTELPHQTQIRIIYDGTYIQVAVAILIFLNFLVSAAASQYGINPPRVFEIFDLIFTITFTLELGMNMYAHWIWEFWGSNWNIFDFVIVFISILSISVSSNTNIPGLTVLRLFRAFRVFRLFKRVESLRSIIEGVIKSLPGVFNAFGILVLLMGIWAIMGVELFNYYSRFKTFGAAMLLMFQILTLDGWVEELIALIDHYEDEQTGWVVPTIFFVSYIFIAAIVMINVVIAVLIESFLTRGDGGGYHEDDQISCYPELPMGSEIKVSHCSSLSRRDSLESHNTLTDKRDQIISILQTMELPDKDLERTGILEQIEEIVLALDRKSRSEAKDFLH